MTVGPDPRLVRYVVGAHPDDEMAALSMARPDPGTYPFFLVCTYGEATSLGGGGGLQAALGERVPQPQPFAGPRTPWCGAQRVDAWHAFLDEAVGPVEPVGYVAGLPLWVGPDNARAVADGGDGRLTAAFVLESLTRARSVLDRLPVAGERDAVCAAYWNDSVAGSWLYTHPDHTAVRDALRSSDLGLPGGQWGRTALGDPGAARVEEIPAEEYDRLMGVDEDGTRTGAFQRAYGWLAPEAETGPYTAAGTWLAADTDERTAASRRQAFWHVYGSAPSDTVGNVPSSATR